MEITEVRVKLMEDAGERLQAFCSITLDDAFVVRDLKIIGGPGKPFVAMPSRKLTARCSGCGCKNHLRASYCNKCGGRLREQPAVKDEDGRAKLYADIAHPINSLCREQVQQRVIDAYEVEIARSKVPGYTPPREDFDDEGYVDVLPDPSPVPPPPAANVRSSPTEMPDFQPAEKPRGPHRLPAAGPRGQRPGEVRQDVMRQGESRPGATRASDGFGAGIFE